MLLRRRGLSGFSGLLAVTAIILSSFPTTAASATYKIKQGDTLSAIAHRHHTTVAKLLKANHLRETSILRLGQSIQIPGPKSNTHATGKPASQCTRLAQPAAVHVSANSATLRSGPSTSSRRIAVLPTGAGMKVISRQGKWAKVALSDGTCGFVYRPLLAHGAGSPSRAAAAAVAKSAPEPDRSSNSLIRTAMAYRGTRYVRGGTSRGGFDCSGFTRYVYAKYGVSLPHSSAAQAGKGTRIAKSELKPGDLVFFATYRRGISHVGIYIGNNQFVHASNHGRGVTVDSLGSSYYAPRYRGARRIN